MTASFIAPSVDEIIAKLGAQSTCDAGLTQDPWHFDTTLLNERGALRSEEHTSELQSQR